MRKIYLFLIFSFSLINFAEAQILDDSTENVYGLSSVQIFKYEDILENTGKTSQPDTSIANFYLHRKIDIDREDLGVIGSASKLVYDIGPNSISTESGFNSFFPYSQKVEDFNFYNARTPFTRLGYIQSTRGLTNLGFTFSRNYNSRLNFTIKVDRRTAAKQFPDRDQTSAFKREDPMVKTWNFDISSNYFSKDSSYSFLATYYHFNNTQIEQGGIYKPEFLSINADSLVGNYSQTYEGRMSGAQSNERWNNLFIYQQFKIRNGFQLYYRGDFKRQKYFYTDNNFLKNLESSVYVASNDFSPDTLHQKATNNVIDNYLGIKGQFKGFDYRLFGRFRFYNYIIESDSVATINQKTLKPEFFVGGQMSFYFNQFYLKARGEIGIGAKADNSASARYSLRGNLFYKNFEVSYLSILAPPTILESNWTSSLVSWKNTFKNKGANEFNIKLPIKLNKFFFVPEFRTLLLDNYIYFDKDYSLKQNDKLINLSQLKAQVSFNSKHWSLTNNFNWVILNSSKDIVRTPSFAWHGNVDFNFTYAKVLVVHIGIDNFYKTSYLADAYQPLTQSFYIQNDFKTWGAYVADVYSSFNINRVRFAFIFGHLNQGLFGTNAKVFNQGYYTTPYYLGQHRSFIIKINWPLFD